MVIAPEHELVEQITTPEQKTAVEEYIDYVKSRSERERMAEKKIMVYLQVLMPSILLMEEKFPSGYQNMCWQVMVPVLSWPCLR